MNFKVDVDELKKALNAVKDTVGSEKVGNEGLRIFADAKGRVRLTTNDGSYATDTWINADVETSGEIVLMAKLFIGYFSRINAGVNQAVLKLNANQNLVVKTKYGTQTFNRLDSDKFNMILEDEPSTETDISGKAFKQMVNGVSFATVESKERPVMEGIHLSSNGKVTQFSATNGLTIATIKKKLSIPKGTITMGKKALVAVARIVRDDEKVTYLEFDKAVRGLRYGHTTYIFPTFNGHFPDAKSAISRLTPKSFAVVDRLELIQLLERAIPLCENFAFMRIDGSKLTIKGSNAFGSFNEFMLAGMEGKPIEVRFSIRHLIDIAKSIQDESVEVGLEKGKPLSFRPDSRLNQICVLAAVE